MAMIAYKCPDIQVVVVDPPIPKCLSASSQCLDRGCSLWAWAIGVCLCACRWH